MNILRSGLTGSLLFGLLYALAPSAASQAPSPASPKKPAATATAAAGNDSYRSPKGRSCAYDPGIDS